MPGCKACVALSSLVVALATGCALPDFHRLPDETGGASAGNFGNDAGTGEWTSGGATNAGAVTSMNAGGYGGATTTQEGAIGGFAGTGGTGAAGNSTTSGGSPSNGGTIATGGVSAGVAATATGGAKETSGGAVATGGASGFGSGGAPSAGGIGTGGSQPMAGAASTGGEAGNGGATIAGTSVTGGTMAGGASTGGVLAAGGLIASTETMNEGGTTGIAGTELVGGLSATGGTNGTGGTPATGGTETTGGMVTETGGASSTGGITSTGGVESSSVSTGGVSTGGVSTGGVNTGGVSTGGVNTGGVNTGGVSSGGSSSCVVRVSCERGYDDYLGDSWSTALRRLQAGLDLARYRIMLNNLGSCEVWIAAGVCKPSTTDTSASFAVSDNVSLYGGFAGTETDRSQRNLATSETVLSGDLNGDGSVASKAIVTMANTNVGPELDGLTFKGGGQAVIFNTGGVKVSNCRFVNNSSAIRIPMDGLATVNACAFSGNGTAITVDASYSAGTSATIDDSIFDNNGTSISSSSGNLTISGSTFSNNNIGITAIWGNINVTQSQFINNHQSAVRTSELYATIANSSFMRNTGSDGAGLYVTSSYVDIVGSLFWGNSASGSGGAFYLDSPNMESTNLSMTNCTLNSNTAVTGGAVASGWGELSFRNSILWGNPGPGNAVSVQPYFTSSVFYASSVVEGGTGTTVINQNPLFVDSANGDLHLKNGSLAINSGDPSLLSTHTLSVDLDGNPRVVGVVDMGAYEQ